MSRDWLKRLWYNGLRVIVRITAVGFFRARTFGANLVPAEGPVLLLCNHQSNLDPVLVGMSCERHLHYLARETLFDIPWLRGLMLSLNAIPIDRDGSGLAGLKATMKVLKQGRIVLLFPEGTRTKDGEVHRLKPGFCTLARRCKATLVPVAIEGAFDSWPRGTSLPKPHPVSIVFGKPISPERVVEIKTDPELVQAVETEIRRCHGLARRQMQRGRWKS